MYLSFTREVPNDFYKKYFSLFHNYINFTDTHERKLVSEYIHKFGITNFSHLFDIIGIKYSSIADNGMSYYLPDKSIELELYELSSGERSLLYAFMLNDLNRKLILVGLTERIDETHRIMLDTNNKRLSNLVILVNINDSFNIALLKKYYIPFTELIKGGFFL